MIINVQKLKSFLNLFPLHEEISYCFAYGSAIFEQGLKRSSTEHHKSKSSKMIDLVLVVNDSLKWHQANLVKNWSHYSSLRYLGPSNITELQEKFGAKIYYNTLIPIENIMIKYGVISKKDFKNDLLDWETLYLSGRLHKPIYVLHQNDNDNGNSLCLQSAVEMNRQSALHTALLLLSEKFTEEQLYMTIAGLSYSGDFRMWFGEDRLKVEKIVCSQIKEFQKIYSPLIKSDLLNHLVEWSEENNCFKQNCSHSSVQWHLNLLPKNVQFNIGRRWLTENTSPLYRGKSPILHRFDMDDLMRTVAQDIEYRRYLRRAIQTIVFQSSLLQTFKGFFTAGPSKSIIYSANKLKKMFWSLWKVEKT